MTKLYEVYHYVYGYLCADLFCGKESKTTTIGIFTDTEENIKSFVEKMNTDNHCSVKNEYDEDFLDENYFSYREIKPVSVEEYLMQKESYSKTSNKELKDILKKANVTENELKLFD